jgi:hypothetical protein
MINEYVLARMRVIQKELDELQRVAARQLQTQQRKVKLKGVWKGVHVSDEDIREAKRAIFKDAYTPDQ